MPTPEQRGRRSSEDTREHVLAVARELFYWHGIRATGVDTIAREAGVAPTTLYRLFAGKDDLVAAYVEREAGRYQEWFSAAVADTSLSAHARTLALFDALTAQLNPDRCRGCPFQMGLAELSDPTLPGHAAAVAVKAWTLDQLRRLTRDLAASDRPPAVDPIVLADQLMLVLEGAYASVQSLTNAGPAREVRALVERLIQ